MRNVLRGLGVAALLFTAVYVFLPHSPPSLSERERRFLEFDLGAYAPIPMETAKLWIADWKTYGETARPIFTPYVHFTDPPYKSPSIHLQRDSHQFIFRGSEEGADDLFFLGGSTTLGYGVGDTWTLPARLEVALNKAQTVRNYGHASYSWTQELILLHRLLEAGATPRTVVFLDGVNLPRGEGGPKDSRLLARLWDEVQFGGYLRPWPLPWPVISWINESREASNARLFESRYPQTELPFDEEVEKTVRSYETFLQSATAILEARNIQPLFLWQPMRAYRCGVTHEEIPEGWRPAFHLMNAVSIRLSTHHARHYYFLGHECEEAGKPESLFVDRVHYSPRFLDHLAKKIATLLPPVRNKSSLSKQKPAETTSALF